MATQTCRITWTKCPRAGEHVFGGQNVLVSERRSYEHCQKSHKKHNKSIYMADTDPADNYIFHPLVLRECNFRSGMAVRSDDIWGNHMLLGVRRIRFLVSGSYSIFVIHSYCYPSRLAY